MGRRRHTRRKPIAAARPPRRDTDTTASALAPGAGAAPDEAAATRDTIGASPSGPAVPASGTAVSAGLRRTPSVLVLGAALLTGIGLGLLLRQPARQRTIAAQGSASEGAAARLDTERPVVLQPVAPPLDLPAIDLGTLVVSEGAAPQAGAGIPGQGEDHGRQQANLAARRPAGRPALAGMVRDARGGPVSGARISAGQPAVSAVSADDGAFTLTGVPVGASRVRVAHPGYAPAEVPIGAGALEVRLQPGGGVSGQVRDRRLGVVPEGVRLTLEAPGLRRQVELGADGRFRTTGLPAGPATLRAAAPGYVPQTLAVDVTAADEPGLVTVRDEIIELEQGGIVTGEVRKDGAGAAGVVVVIVDEVGDEVVRLQTDRKGVFRSGPVRPGKLGVRASGLGGEASERASVYAGDEARVLLDLR